jgi:hypothetical protein
VHALQVSGLGIALAQLGEARVLADRDELHLRRDDALACVVHLADVGAGLGLARRADVAEAQRCGLVIRRADAAVDRARAAQLLGVAARVDPGLAQRRQAGGQIDARTRIGVRSGSVVDRDRRVRLQALDGARCRQADLAHRYAQTTGPRDVNLAAGRERAAHVLGQFFGLLEDRIGNSAHARLSAAR